MKETERKRRNTSKVHKFENIWLMVDKKTGGDLVIFYFFYYFFFFIFVCLCLFIFLYINMKFCPVSYRMLFLVRVEVLLSCKYLSCIQFSFISIQPSLARKFKLQTTVRIADVTDLILCSLGNISIPIKKCGYISSAICLVMHSQPCLAVHLLGKH